MTFWIIKTHNKCIILNNYLMMFCKIWKLEKNDKNGRETRKKFIFLLKKKIITALDVSVTPIDEGA